MPQSPGSEPSSLPREERGGDPISELAEQLLDDWLPSELEWRPIVLRYPIGTVLAVAGFGAWLGWCHGRRLMKAAADLLAAGVEERLAGLLPEDEGA